MLHKIASLQALTIDNIPRVLVDDTVLYDMITPASTLYLEVSSSLLLKLIGVMMNLETIQTRHKLKKKTSWKSVLRAVSLCLLTWFAGLLGLYSG